MLSVLLFFMFYMNYLFSIVLLLMIVLYFMMFCTSSFMYLKFLVMMIYLSGIVVFILYISCLCWNSYTFFLYPFLFFILFVFNLYDLGLYSNIYNLGDSFWMFMFFSFLFSMLVTFYSLNLFKVSGSLRF